MYKDWSFGYLPEKVCSLADFCKNVMQTMLEEGKRAWNPIHTKHLEHLELVSFELLFKECIAWKQAITSSVNF